LDNNKPLYSVIYDHLKEQIESGHYAADQQLPTETELADMFQVSRITSKRALSELERDGYIVRRRGSGSYVKPKSERKPLQFSEPGALSVVHPSPGQRPKIVAMVLPFTDSTGLTGYIRGASDYLDETGYYLSIHTTSENPYKEREHLETLPGKGISGIIFYPIEDIKNLAAVHKMYMDRFPIVTIDKYYECLPVASVVSDNFGGGYAVTKRLIELGHRKIAFISSVSIESTTSVRNRYYGYCRALRDGGLTIESDLVVLDFVQQTVGDTERKFLRKQLERLLQLKITAVQAENDLLAIDLLKTALELGLKVPEDLSIAGFDNNEISRHLDIPMTTVEQNFYAIGRKAAEMIVRSIESNEIIEEKIVMPVKLIERPSIGPV